MLTSLSFVFLLGLAMAALCQRIKIPRIIGMLITGILLGPCVLNWLSDSVLGDFFRAASDGADHHIAESGIVPESGRSEEGRQTGAYDVLCSCQF